MSNKSRVASRLVTACPLPLGCHAAWKPSRARGVTQMRSRGMTPSSMVHADRHGPSIITRSPEPRKATRFSRYGPIWPPESALMRTVACAVDSVSAAATAPARTAIFMLILSVLPAPAPPSRRRPRFDLLNQMWAKCEPPGRTRSRLPCIVTRLVRAIISPPQRQRRRMDAAMLVTKPIQPVAREQERTVEIDHARALRKQHGWCHGERGRDHAADHERQSEALGFSRHGERLGQAAGLVELDVDGVVFSDKRGERRTRVRALVRADGERVGDARERVVMLRGQRLLDERHGGLGASGEVCGKIALRPALVGIDDQLR